MSKFVVRIEFEEYENARYIQKRIKQELGLDFNIGEEPEE